MTLQHLTHRRFVRRKIAGTVTVRQDDHQEAWSALEISERGIRTGGPIDHIDTDRPVFLWVKLGYRYVDVTAVLRWTRGEGEALEHGWELTEVPDGFGRLVAAERRKLTAGSAVST